MRPTLCFVLVFLLMGFGVAPLAAQAYNPTWTKAFEISMSPIPVQNTVGAITLAVGSAGSGSASIQNPNVFVYPITLAFPAVSVSRGAMNSAAQLVAAFVNGVNAQSGASGYSAGVLYPPSRFYISGPASPNVSLRGFDVGIFHGEIDPLNGLMLTFGGSRDVYNLCDGIVGNELSQSTGLGIDIKTVTIANAQIGGFELFAGQVVPANFDWDGVGQVSVSSTPQLGFPTGGSNFLHLTTAGNWKMSVAAAFRYDSANPVLRFSYRWINGEGGSAPANNDRFAATVQTYAGGSNAILYEDTFTPLSAGTRGMEVFLPEILYFLQAGDWITLWLDLENVGSTANDSSVLVDDISFLPYQGGEGNGDFTTFSPMFQLATSSWHPTLLNWGPSTADKKVRPGGLLTLYLWQNGLPWNWYAPFVIMAEVLPFASQPLLSLPGEYNVIGLGTGMIPLWSGTFGGGYPPLTFLLPPSLPFDGIYLQAGLADPTALNGVRISNRVRHRFE